MMHNWPRRSKSSMTTGCLFAGLAAVLNFANPGCAPVPDQSMDDTHRRPTTLRIDMLHTGSADTESFSLDELILEGPWPGPVGTGIESPIYGPYSFQIRDPHSGDTLLTEGFASIFGEWETIPEALDTTRTFHESLRIPEPDGPVTLTIFKRDRSQQFREVWTTVLDPASARSSTPRVETTPWSVMESGPPAEKVDIVLLGDGYAASEMDKWHEDARRLTDTLFAYEPFAGRRMDFNVRAIDTPSETSGIANPSAGLKHATPIGATYDSFGMERYVLTFANKRWRDIAAAVPYEFVVIVANGEKYGGAGIYNLFSTVASDNAFTGYVLVHEFGHHFAGLGDEYYTSDVAYSIEDERPEPWSPNVTADAGHPKWIDLVADSTPLPTPWPKVEFELLQAEVQARRKTMREKNVSEDEIAALFREERERSRELLAGAEYAETVGAFEGANYASSGYYRSEVNCIMFTRDVRHFCRVCSRAIVATIDRLTRENRDQGPGTR